MKVLYIYPLSLYEGKSGGGVVHRSNHAALQNFFGVENVIKYPVYRRGSKNKLKMFINDIFSLGFAGLNKKNKREIVSKINVENIESVFIDSSIFGCLSYEIKTNTKAKVFVFFHNVEYDFWKDQVRLKRNYYHSYKIILALINERMAVKYADRIITLNHKDSARLFELYKRRADKEIPVAIKEEKICIDTQVQYHHPLRLLFFGSNFPPNIEAAEILINEICPYINAKVTIAGNGMDVLREKYACTDKIQIQGFVDNISDMYNSSDLMVLPIMSGAGMKVKTAEALEYGKNILASSNALEGYDVNGINGVIKCDTAQEFIHAINNFDLAIPRFNQSARQLFINKYSYDALYCAYNNLFEELTRE